MDYAKVAALVSQEVERLLAPTLEKLSEAAKLAPEYLTLAQAADLTNFSYDYIYDAVRGGSLPAIKKGRDWRVAAADLRTWMDKDRARNPSPTRSEKAELTRRHFPGLSS